MSSSLPRTSSPTGGAGGRLVWMDQVRGLAILLVVAFHGRTVLRRFVPDVPGWLYDFTAFFAPFRMPLLMFLSGMLLARSLTKPPRTYFLGKARGIAWPYLVWSCLFLLVAGRASPESIPAVLWSPPSYLWYLPYLLAYYAVAWGAHALRLPLPVVAGVVLSASLSFAEWRRFAFLFVFFAAGDAYVRHRSRFPRGDRRIWACVAGAVVLAGGLASTAGADLKYEPQHLVVPAAGVALCLLLAPQHRAGAVARVLGYIGRHSLVFFVSHFVTLWAVHSSLAAVGFSDAVLAYILGVCLALTVGLALAEGRRWWAVDALFSFPERRPRVVAPPVVPVVVGRSQRAGRVLPRVRGRSPDARSRKRNRSPRATWTEHGQG